MSKMGALINLNGINKIYYNGVEIKIAYANDSVVYQNDGIDRTYNHFVFDTSEITGDAPVTITLANYRAGDETKWDGLTDWGDGTIDNKLAHTYNTKGVYTVKTKWMINNRIDSKTYFADSNTIKTFVACNNVNRRITDVTYLFYYCTSLKSVDMSNFRTKNITNMEAMFYNCIALEELNMSGWDTSKVTSMREMFSGCKRLTPKVSHFNVSNVYDFNCMFSHCGAIDGSQFKNWRISTTVSAIDMSYIFCGATITTNCLDLSNWNVSKVTSLFDAFYKCCVYEGIDISGWDIRDVCNVSWMFKEVYCRTCTRTSPHHTERHVDHVGVPPEDWFKIQYHK
jgi:surface protein